MISYFHVLQKTPLFFKFDKISITKKIFENSDIKFNFWIPDPVETAYRRKSKTFTYVSNTVHRLGTMKAIKPPKDAKKFFSVFAEIVTSICASVDGSTCDDIDGARGKTFVCNDTQYQVVEQVRNSNEKDVRYFKQRFF